MGATKSEVLAEVYWFHVAVLYIFILSVSKNLTTYRYNPEPLSHQRPFIITPPSVGNKAEKQCLPSYKPHNLSANPLSVQFFVSLWFFIYSSLFEMEVACWTGPSFAGFS
ncbi:hypothetical protein AFLA_009107 [Aspergillus flavus NRRL3357]|nr:hypothetical protein AFLA_009107 [Aspergillus flavus NRRL3357]